MMANECVCLLPTVSTGDALYNNSCTGSTDYTLLQCSLCTSTIYLQFGLLKQKRPLDVVEMK